MKRSHLVLWGLAGAVAIGVGCSANGVRHEFGGEGGEGGEQTTTGINPSTGEGGSSAGSNSSGMGGDINFTSGTGAGVGGGSGTCQTDAKVDDDNDGFTEEQGDCNDCDANVNPGAIEVVSDDPMAKAADEDCDGSVDNVAPACDDNLALADTDAKNGARAIDLCQFITPADTKWGVLDAKYVRANGNTANPSVQFGILSDFGPNVKTQLGTRMLALSSGAARTPSQPGASNSYTFNGYGGGSAPPGFPQNAPGCEQGTTINDDVGLQLKIRAPKNATGYKYLFKFYSFEFAEYVCTQFNDQYIALVDPAPAGSKAGNISFDKNGNPVSVNIAFFDVCDPVGNNDFAAYCFGGCPSKPSPYCPSGPSELIGTGFTPDAGEDAGGTAWLQTQAPVKGGDEFTIRFAIWDTQDQIYDSTVLLDGFQWVANGGTVVVGTEPIPDPK